jgi:hypothetical protein
MTDQQPEAPAVPGVTRWRLKSSELDATRWDGTAKDATRVIDWILSRDGTARYHDDPAFLVIDLPRGTVRVMPGYWIIRCEDGTFRPLTEKVFFDLHEPVGVLVSGEWRARAEAAEAKLDAIGDEIEAGWPGLRPSTRLGSGTAVQRIRAITDTKGDADRG